MLKMRPHVVLQIGPYTLSKSQVIHTFIDFDKFYMFLDQNLEMILLVRNIFKLEQTKTMFASNLQKTPSCFFTCLYIFQSLAKLGKYLFASESFKDFKNHVFSMKYLIITLMHCYKRETSRG